MENDIYTEEFAEIMAGARERNEARKILNAWDAAGLPDDFSDDGVKFAFNRTSGNVFLINSDYQCAMRNDDALESFYTTPYDGREGFWNELTEQYSDMCEEDQEYMRDIANGRELPTIEE
jgi:hypothetical protein